MGRKYFGGLTFEEAVAMGKRAQAGDVEAQQRLYAGSDQMKASGDPILPMRHDLYDRANAWASQPGLWDTPYGGQMTAGLSPLHGAATGVAQGVANFSPNQVTGGSFTSGDWGAYMNPYTQNVVDLAMSDIDRSRQIANQAGARSAGASTYGGDRNALIEAETNRGYADVAARTAAQLRSQGFDTAAGLMGQDLNRSYGAGLANQQAGLQGAGLNLQAGGMLSGLGQQEQMTNQGGLDREYNEWLRSRFGPMQGFQFLSGMQSGFPMQQPQGSPWSGLAGLGLTGAGLLMGGPAGALAVNQMPTSWTGGT